MNDRAPPQASAPTHRGARLALIVLLTLSSVSLLFQSVLPSMLPDPAELEHVAARLSKVLKPNDAMLLLPSWQETPRPWLPASLELLTLPPDDPQLKRYPRLWVLAFPTSPGAEIEDALATLAARFGPPRFDRSLAHLRLLRYEHAVRAPRFVLSDRIEQAGRSAAAAARSGLRILAGARPCTLRARGRTAARFQCPTASWNYVGTETRGIAGQARRCVWVHPLTKGTLSLSLPLMAGIDRFELYGGFVGNAAFGGGAPVQIEVQDANGPLHRSTIRPEPGWQHSSFASAPSLAGPLELRISTPDAGRRHLCIELYGYASQDPKLKVPGA